MMFSSLGERRARVSTMAQSSRITVTMKYGNQVRVRTMSSQKFTRLSSMEQLKRLIYKIYPGVGRLCGDSSARSNSKLNVQIEGHGGDLVSIDNDGDLKSRMASEDRSNLVFHVHVNVKKQQAAHAAGSAEHNWPSCASSSSPLKCGETPAKLLNCKTRGKQPCGNSNLGRGSSKFGSDRNFSHDRHRKARKQITAVSLTSQTAAAPAKIVTEYELWLREQYERGASHNITFLSRDQGFDLLAKIVEQKNLSGHSIEVLVKLLSREEFRVSLMREHTNQVYGLLIGSSFLLQLQGHIRSQLLAAKPQDVMPYLLLIEELMSRTTGGWKEVPLRAVNSVIQKLEAGSAKTELVRMVNRLFEHRNKLRMQATPSPSESDDHRFLGVDFRTLSIVPDREELLQPNLSSDLPVNLVGKKYPSIDKYLETHFRLLREDCIDSLRQGIKAFGKNQSSRELRIYQQVRLVGNRCGDDGVEHVVSFQDSGRTNSEGSKCLLYGALVCLSSDGFQDSFIVGVVTGNSQGKGTARVTVQIRVMDKREVAGEAPIMHDRTYVMVESATAYFEAYYHVLKNLQKEDMKSISFRKYLLDLEPQVDPPFYLLRRSRGNGDEFDFEPVFPSMKEDIGRSVIHVMQDWPQWPCTLDGAQLQALKHGLTKELSIIQGPPGTGKTFMGLLLVKLLLANFKPAENGGFSRWRENGGIRTMPFERSEDEIYGRKGPILVVCMTNHALDQFLEGIYKFEKNLIRVGARSKSKVLQERTLKKVREEERLLRRETLAGHRAATYYARQEKDYLSGKIQECILKSRAGYVRKHDLINIATDVQIRELFSAGLLSSAATVKSWLAGDVNPLLADPFHAEGEPLQGYFENLINSDSEDGARDKNNPPRMKRSGKVITLSRDYEHGENGGQVRTKKRNHGTNTSVEIVNMKLVRGTEAADEYLPPRMREEPGMLEEISARDDDEFQQEVQARGGVDLQQPHVDNNDQVGIEQIVQYSDVWSLNTEQRRTLHEYWLGELRMKCRRELQLLTTEYEKICRTVRQIDNDITLYLLRKANVVGITTTTAAKFREILKALNSEILIVEEAAEVLEGHILGGLSSHVKHLVLIGDHLQLRPSTAVYQLGTKHKLDVSMFERLIQGGVEHVTLQEQRRMRPSFSKLVKSLYPKLKNHGSVSQYESIKGVTANLLFFDHTAKENSTTVDTSKVNSTEAKLVVELTLYLMKQDCYSAQDIAILTMYSGQLMEIKKLLKERAASSLSANYFESKRKMQQTPGGPEEEDNGLPRVRSVDDFQGEESDIIILSLVRSNDIQTREGKGTIGFLKTSNRICVALTRAKKGMYIFGNATLLAKRSSLWSGVVDTLRKDNALDTKLELVCTNHPETKTVITREEDFKQVRDGGCSRPCELQLECGHVCPRRCHSESHHYVLCPKPCLRSYSDCLHACTQDCHGSSDCPSCQVRVMKTFPGCGHSQIMKCGTDPSDETCMSPCPKLLECLHGCSKVCGVPCTRKCVQMIARELRCGHRTNLPCHLDALTYSCKEPCGAMLSGCEHQCQGTCSKCKNGREHIPCLQKCGRTLPCGHACEAGCSAPCPPCKKKCQKRCFHSRCQLSCSEICVPCREPCPWQCEHHKCQLLCHEICARPRCDLACRNVLKCGHPCIGLCGEPCPSKCRLCHPKTLEFMTRTTLEQSEESACFLQLQDCGHLFEVTNLDNWMDSVNGTQSASTAILKLECPHCKTPVWKSMRYGNSVKTRQENLERVKNKMFGYEKTRKGQLKLEEGDHQGAYADFLAALQHNPVLMNAYFGAGIASCSAQRYLPAAAFFSFIVEKSSYAAEVKAVLRNTDILDLHFGTSNVYCCPPNEELTVKAMLQLAAVFTAMNEFSSAEKLCDAVIKRQPGNSDAHKIKRSANSGVPAMVVQAMSREVGERGHWFQCPNGHYFTIGECGGPMQQPECPDCKAVVGGGNSTLAAGNKHANIDGFTRPGA